MWLSFVNIGTGGHSQPNQQHAITWADTDAQFYLRWQNICEIYLIVTWKCYTCQVQTIIWTNDG